MTGLVTGRNGAVDELDIQRLLAEYCHRCDDRDFAAVAEAFTEDGAFVFGRRSFEGRTQIASGLAGMQPADGKHMSSNVVVLVAGDETTAVSDFVFLVKAEGRFVPFLAGRSRDDLQRGARGWKLHRRRVEAL